MATARHGNPHLARQLGGEPMKLQGREQAKHRLWHLGSNRDEGFVLRRVASRQPIKTSPHLFKLAVRREPGQYHARSTNVLQIPRTQHALLASQIKDALGVGVGAHGPCSMFHLFVECKYSTNKW